MPASSVFIIQIELKKSALPNKYYLVGLRQGVNAVVELFGLGQVVVVPVGHAGQQGHPPVAQRVGPSRDIVLAL